MTVKELAKIAGVSPAAVSIVLNNKKGVSAETRRHILEIIDQYHYSNPKQAKVPQKNILFLKHIDHGMIVEENNGFIAAILDSIVLECRSYDYNLSVITSEGSFAETVSRLDFKQYNGVIVLGTELQNCDYPALEQIRVPFVVVDNPMRNFNCSSISINNAELVYCALKHLKELGHREIAYFHSNTSIPNFEERQEAFRRYCSELGMGFSESSLFELTPTLMGAYSSMREYLLRNFKLPTCAFADNDTIAIGAIKALKEQGIHVPQDISVIGFDDIPFCTIVTPSMSTMRVPKTVIGTEAVRRLVVMMGEDVSHSVKVQVGGEIVLRDSIQKLC